MRTSSGQGAGVRGLGRRGPQTPCSVDCWRVVRPDQKGNKTAGAARDQTVRACGNLRVPPPLLLERGFSFQSPPNPPRFEGIGAERSPDTLLCGLLAGGPPRPKGKQHSRSCKGPPPPPPLYPPPPPPPPPHLLQSQTASHHTTSHHTPPQPTPLDGCWRPLCWLRWLRSYPCWGSASPVSHSHPLKMATHLWTSSLSTQWSVVGWWWWLVVPGWWLVGGRWLVVGGGWW